ncbi:MAG TPA: hypothetical protein VGM15_00695 [Burkholderiaceae bacterium]
MRCNICAGLFFNSALDAPVIERSRRASMFDATASGGFDSLKMSIGRIIILMALAPAVHAQLPQAERPLTADPSAMVFGVPFSLRLELGSPLIASRSSVFTSDYWSRAYTERSELENRFGIHLFTRLLKRSNFTRSDSASTQCRVRFTDIV